MATKPQVTIEDLYHVREDGKAEIVDGELNLMSPTGDFPSRAGGHTLCFVARIQCRPMLA